MRSIIFRGKRKDNGEWITGHLYEKAAPLRCIGEQEKGEFYIIFAGFADWNMPRPMYEVEIIPETAGQYTNFHDKNGKKIYEGDRWLWDGRLWEIKWKDEYACLVPVSIDFGNWIDAWSECIAATGEVISNIHDNSELHPTTA